MNRADSCNSLRNMFEGERNDNGAQAFSAFAESIARTMAHALRK
jgi:hypothetical protein